jgi:hypothetical protein
MDQAVHAWEHMARDSSFSSMSVDDFKLRMQQSAAAHARVDDLRRDLRHALATRDEVDARCMALLYRIGCSISGHPDFGWDSALLEAMGFTTETVRRMRIRRGMRRSAQRSREDARSLPEETEPSDPGVSHPATVG